MNIIKSGIERKIMHEKEMRKQHRQQLDLMTGLTSKDVPMRKDYKLCRENDKLYNEYRRFTDKRDREKIKKELEITRREYGYKKG